MATDTLVIFYFLGTFLLIIFAVSLTVLLVVQKNKSFQAKLAQQQMENKYNNQLLETKLEVQEQSLKYFSEEIHDNILQVLSIIKLQIHTSKVRSHDDCGPPPPGMRSIGRSPEG
ncbi:MAG: hypothetical protein EBZ77_03200, partial [Chitinophagia bacterium]|nr:hypothetical protein [Chitinophagia bacterium]